MDEIDWNLMFSTLARAGMEYSGLHRVLTAVFVNWKCGADSESLADVTLDRLAKRISQGKEVQNLVSYSRKIADYVYKEYCRDREKFRKALRELEYLKPDAMGSEEDTEVFRKCQRTCIKTLPASDHQLMMAYYTTGKDRTTLAVELGIPLATLRTNIHRLKLRLAKCAENCWRLAWSR